MTVETSRRAFLRGAFKEETALRPFGAIAEPQFQAACTACDNCLQACPEGIIVKDNKGLPLIDPNVGACTFCSACIDACEAEALLPDIAWQWKAEAKPSCLSLNAVQCRTCQDHCDERAISFRLMPGGLAQPNIDLDLCKGCGGCIGACPINAIHLITPNPRLESQPC